MGKRVKIGVVAVSFLALINKLRKDKSRQEKCEQKEKLIYKQERNLSVYENWVETYWNRLSIADYLIKNHYNKVAIYGWGRIGKQLYDQLSSEGIEIAYIIDRNLNTNQQIYKNICFYNLNDKLPMVDLIIVSIPGEAREIIALLRRKINYNIKSIEDIFFVI